MAIKVPMRVSGGIDEALYDLSIKIWIPTPFKFKIGKLNKNIHYRVKARGVKQCLLSSIQIGGSFNELK